VRSSSARIGAAAVMATASAAAPEGGEEMVEADWARWSAIGRAEENAGNRRWLLSARRNAPVYLKAPRSLSLPWRSCCPLGSQLACLIRLYVCGYAPLRRQQLCVQRIALNGNVRARPADSLRGRGTAHSRIRTARRAANERRDAQRAGRHWRASSRLHPLCGRIWTAWLSAHAKARQCAAPRPSSGCAARPSGLALAAYGDSEDPVAFAAPDMAPASWDMVHSRRICRIGITLCLSSTFPLLSHGGHIWRGVLCNPCAGNKEKRVAGHSELVHGLLLVLKPFSDAVRQYCKI
jgi:hypothetical protein